jgi:hypothetical protein
LGTVEKDEAAILKALEKKPKGIRSTDLWLAVRGSVRSLTTFQKRLKHLEQMGRVEIKTDITDPRARVITPTELSGRSRSVLDAIDLLERHYLGKAPRRRNSITVAGVAGGIPVQESSETINDLLIIAHTEFKEALWDEFRRVLTDNFGGTDLYIGVFEEGAGRIHIHIMPRSIVEKEGTWNTMLKKHPDWFPRSSTPKP